MTPKQSSLSNYFILLGLLCLIFFSYLFWQRNNPQRLAFRDYFSKETVVTLNQLSQPEQLIIEDLKINLQIYPFVINNGRWQVSEKGVSYLSSSPIPGEVGNSILYGHNWTNLLGSLPRIKPNQIIKIVYQDGSTKKFVVTSTQVVSWKDTSVLNQTTQPKITLYTCTGFLDSKRFVVSAIPSD